MKASTKYLCLYSMTLAVLILMVTGLARAQSPVPPPPGRYEIETVDDDDEHLSAPADMLNQAELDQTLAPIALYPDTLLSHILVASTYPLEVVQASRWRAQHADLSADAAREAVQDQDWDPSVKALVPFADLLDTMSKDLDWLKRLGDAFLLNEDQLLSSVQALRRKARDQGSLEDNAYIEVHDEDNDIIIQPVEREVVYVPYYDTRVVYGPWWWHDHTPVYWHHPHHNYNYAGFYWGPRIFVRPRFYFGGFHWRRRYTVINHHVFHHGVRYDDGIRRVRVREYPRWRHNPGHRRGVRYHHSVRKSLSRHNKARPLNRFTDHHKARQTRVRTEQADRSRTRADVALNTRETLRRQRDKPGTHNNALRHQPRAKLNSRLRRQESSKNTRSPDKRMSTPTTQREVKRSTRQFKGSNRQRTHQAKPRDIKRFGSPKRAPQKQRSTPLNRTVKHGSAPQRTVKRQ